MEKQKIKELFHKYAAGQCSDAEKVLVEQFYERLTASSSDDAFIDEFIQNDINEIYKHLPIRHKNTRSRFWPQIAAAAILLIFMSIGFYFYNRTTNSVSQDRIHLQVSSDTADILPGSDKAILHLSDGSTIRLDDTKEGSITKQEGIKIIKNEGLLVYNKEISAEIARSNTLSTPKGGQYKVILADGTKVWLNAASSITYPTSFLGKERKVMLEGEAYFEVAKNKDQPFKVVTKQQELEVLGTNFNVNSYSDEPDIKTTLLSGSVKVSDNNNKQSTLLKPGEQSTLKKNGNIHVSSINTENVIAWKSGLFQFHDSDIQQAMRQLARWYDIDIEFEGLIPNIKLWGEVHRNANAKEALEVLSYFDLKYRIVAEGNAKKIIIIQ